MADWTVRYTGLVAEEVGFMAGKRLLALAILTLVSAAVVSCTGSSRPSRPEGLQFVGEGVPKQGHLKGKGLVIVTHGWIEEGRGDWPEDMAIEIYKRVDPNLWSCGYFDWSKGAKTLNPTDAAKYARDIAGPELAGQIIKLGGDIQHIHLIGHSGGCWAVSEAAKTLAKETKADLHLTFLDAYVPAFWEESMLGDVNTPGEMKCWVEHYYTRDYTLKWTEQNLSNAHNVDITDIDQGIKDHNFPWRWYYATVTGKFPKGYFLDDRKLTWTAGGTEYGFLRSREAPDPNGWEKSLKLPVGNEAVKMERKR